MSDLHVKRLEQLVAYPYVIALTTSIDVVAVSAFDVHGERVLVPNPSTQAAAPPWSFPRGQATQIATPTSTE